MCGYLTGVPALVEELEKAKSTPVIDKGQTIAWGTNGKGTPYDVVKYSDGTIVRKLRHAYIKEKESSLQK